MALCIAKVFWIVFPYFTIASTLASSSCIWEQRKKYWKRVEIICVCSVDLIVVLFIWAECAKLCNECGERIASGPKNSYSMKYSRNRMMYGIMFRCCLFDKTESSWNSSRILNCFFFLLIIPIWKWTITMSLKKFSNITHKLDATMKTLWISLWFRAFCKRSKIVFVDFWYFSFYDLPQSQLFINVLMRFVHFDTISHFFSPLLHIHCHSSVCTSIASNKLKMNYDFKTNLYYFFSHLYVTQKPSKYIVRAHWSEGNLPST